MSPAVMLMMVALSSAPCVVPSDQTAGWKAIAIPGSAPALAAPPDVQQFRGGEEVLVWSSERRAYLGATDAGPGRVRYEFSLPKGAHRAELDFGAELRGAKVDVDVWAGARELPVLREKRVSGSALQVDFDFGDVSTMTVLVRYHFRAQPLVTRWRFASTLDVTREAGTPEPFRERGLLYFLHPGGRRIELCHAPGRRLWLERASLEQAPAPVRLTAEGR